MRFRLANLARVEYNKANNIIIKGRIENADL